MQDLRKIAEQKLQENQQFRAEMLSLIASGEALGFIGAGPSAALDYPSWPKLIDILSVEARGIGTLTVDDNAKADALLHAEAIQHFFKDHGKLSQYKSILGREFAPKNGDGCTETHRRLVALPFRGFVTTNYEPCIERALIANAVAKGQMPSVEVCVIKASDTDRHMVSRFLRSIADGQGPHSRKIAHLHGHYSDVDNIILSASDYTHAYGFEFKNGEIIKSPQKATLHCQLSWALFACRRMVFFGCSMDDPYVRALLDAVSTDLWEFGQPIHFVVLPLDSKKLESIDNEMDTFRRYGLQVVLFDNWNGDFQELDLLLLEAAKGSLTGKSTGEFIGASADEYSSTNKALPVDARTELAQPAPRVAGVDLEWLETVNQTTASSLKKHED